MKTPCVGLAVLALGIFSGCVDQYGRVRPPDPIGRAIFDVLDPARPVYDSREYVVTRPYPSSPPRGYYERRTVQPARYSDPYYIEGHWGWRNSNWVWVPGRWVQRPRQNAVWVGGQYDPYTSRYRSGYWR